MSHQCCFCRLRHEIWLNLQAGKLLEARQLDLNGRFKIHLFCRFLLRRDEGRHVAKAGADAGSAALHVGEVSKARRLPDYAILDQEARAAADHPASGVKRQVLHEAHSDKRNGFCSGDTTLRQARFDRGDNFGKGEAGRH